MQNINLSCDKTLFDLFNMVNPNCYQAMIIQDIIDNNIDDAIKHCNALQTAIEYYKWSSDDKNTDYIDSLICQSGLERWQKIAIMYALGNDISKCISELHSHCKQNCISETELNDNGYRERLLHESITRMLHSSDRYPYWTIIPRCL